MYISIKTFVNRNVTILAFFLENSSTTSVDLGIEMVCLNSISRSTEILGLSELFGERSKLFINYLSHGANKGLGRWKNGSIWLRKAVWEVFFNNFHDLLQQFTVFDAVL